jgi:hypothetical protein
LRRAIGGRLRARVEHALEWRGLRSVGRLRRPGRKRQRTIEGMSSCFGRNLRHCGPPDIRRLICNRQARPENVKYLYLFNCLSE